MTAAPVRELVEWIAAEPRPYGEAIERWHSHCPRLTVWEDALGDGLIRIERTPDRGSLVVVTPLGRRLTAET